MKLLERDEHLTAIFEMRLFPDSEKTKNFEVQIHRKVDKIEDGELMHAKSSCRCFPDDNWDTFTILVKDWLLENREDSDNSTTRGSTIP